MRLSRTLSRVLAPAVLIAAAMPAYGQSRANFNPHSGDWLKEVNLRAAVSPGTSSAEDVLFPALAEMKAPPVSVEVGPELDAVLLVAPGSSSWGRLERWARADEQQAVLEALRTLADPDSREEYVFGMQYETEPANAEWAEAGLWIEVPGGLIANAIPHYTERLQWAVALGLVEAMRLSDEGEGEAAIETLVAVTRLGRMLAERPGVEEAKLAYSIMRIASERTRDVVYTFPEAFESDDLKEAIDAFDARRLRPRLMSFPDANKFAALQIIQKTFASRGPASVNDFGSTLAEVEAGERPLRRLSEAALWREVAQSQANAVDQADTIEDVFGDFAARWAVPGYQDDLLKTTPILSRLDGRSRSVAYLLAKDFEDLVGIRTALENDLAGTVASLGVVAFRKAEGKFPPQISGIEPTYVSRMPKDAYHWDRRFRDVHMDMNYWVPIRDQEWDLRREDPVPYTVEIGLPPEGVSLFEASAPAGGAADAVMREVSEKIPAVTALIGRPAPEISLDNWHNNNDGPTTMAQMRGDIVVTIFWATWCGPCKASIPSNNENYAQYKSQGVRFIAICDNGNGGGIMARTADQHSMAYPTALDTSGDAKKAYALPYFPYAVITDRKGTIRAAGVRPQNLGRALAALTAEQPLGWTDGEDLAAMNMGDFDMSGMDMGDFDMSGMDMGDFDMSGMDMTGMGGAGMPGMEAVPDGVMEAIDLQTMTVDVPKLRQALVDEARNSPAVAADVDEMLGLLQPLIDADVTASNASQKIMELMNAGGSAAELQQMSAMAGMFGIDMGQVQSVLGDVVARWVGMPETQAMMTRVKNNETITPQEVKDFEIVTMEHMIVDEVVNPVMGLVRDVMANMGDLDPSMMAGLMGGMAGDAGGKSGTVLLDDTTFLLYSTGPDGLDNRAAKVGAGGDDVLFWPPVMSLTREISGGM